VTLEITGDNIFVDGGLEDWDDIFTPTEWYPATIGSSYVVRNGRVIEDELYWARCIVNASNHSCGIYQPLSAGEVVPDTFLTIEPGEQYRFWFTYKISAQGASFWVNFGIYDENEENAKYLKEDGTFSDDVADSIVITALNTGVNTITDIDMTIPAGYPNLFMFFHNKSMASESFWLDDINLYKLAENGNGGGDFNISDQITITIAERRYATGFTDAPSVYTNDSLDIEIAEGTYVFADQHKERMFINSNILEGMCDDDDKKISCQWRSKRLDFTDQRGFEKYVNTYKTIDTIQLEYVDETASTPVTMYISNDGGVTWDYQTKLLGTGNGKQKIVEYHWLPSKRSTGKYFNFMLESVSCGTKFTWTGLFVLFEPKGEYFSI
jgi:hypothetical protein